MSTEHTPGPWEVTQWSGGEGYRKGFYVSRVVRADRREWLSDPTGRARRLMTEQSARAAIARATGAAS